MLSELALPVLRIMVQTYFSLFEVPRVNSLYIELYIFKRILKYNLPILSVGFDEFSVFNCLECHSRRQHLVWAQCRAETGKTEENHCAQLVDIICQVSYS